MSKDDAISIMNNPSLIDKKGVLYTFLLYIKNEWNNLLSKKKKNRKVILNRAKDYYENDKERLGEQARYKYRNLSENEKTKRENTEETEIIMCLKKKTKD